MMSRSFFFDHMNFRVLLIVGMTTGPLVCGSSAATSAELKMIGNPGMSETMAQIAPEFEKSTGHRVHRELGLF